MNKKTISLIAVAILILGIFFYFFGGDAVIDNGDDLNPTVIINADLEKKVESEFGEKVIKSLKTEDDFDPSKIDVNMEDLENIAAEELFKARKIVPYENEKPPMPDEAENNSTLYGVDVNGNGVRDDLEILAIDQFGYDGDLVESIFAGIRTYDYDMYVVDNFVDSDGRLPDYKIKEINLNSVKLVRCNYLYSQKIGIGNYIYDKYNSSSKRKKNNEIILKNLRGTGGYFKANEKNCKEFFEKTKDYNYR